MNKRPYTDTHELVKAEVECHMRPFIEVTMAEHERTRKKIDEVSKTLKKISGLNYHDVIQYILVGGMFIALLLLKG
jgi:hypothetical protein